MEQQAKERLTGAGLLVVALVLLVPELLTGPRPAPPPVPAQPDQAPMRSYTMDLGDSTRAGSAPVAPSTAVAGASEPAPPVAGSAPRPAAGAAAAPAAAVAPAEPVPVTPPRPAVAAAPAEHASTPRSVAPAHQQASAARAPAHGTQEWTVQLGTFSNRDNAARLVGTLKSHGFSASLGEATRNGHRMFRVRVGAERSEAGAQKLLARLKAAGQKGGEVVPR